MTSVCCGAGHCIWLRDCPCPGFPLCNQTKLCGLRLHYNCFMFIVIVLPGTFASAREENKKGIWEFCLCSQPTGFLWAFLEPLCQKCLLIEYIFGCKEQAIMTNHNGYNPLWTKTDQHFMKESSLNYGFWLHYGGHSSVSFQKTKWFKTVPNWCILNMGASSGSVHAGPPDFIIYPY